RGSHEALANLLQSGLKDKVVMTPVCPGNVRTFWPDRAFQRFTSLWLAVARRFPPGLKAIVLTQVSITSTCSRVPKSQNITASFTPTPRRLPSGLNARPIRTPPFSRRENTSVPLRTSHTLTSPRLRSKLPLANRLPSGLKVTLLTQLE